MESVIFIVKMCRTCKEIKTFEEFTKDKSQPDSKDTQCKFCKRKCEGEYISKNREKYIGRYREKNRELNKKWRNSEKGLKWAFEYAQKNKIRIAKRKKESSKKWRQEQRMKNPMYRIVRALRYRVYFALKCKKKSKHTIELLGCNKDFFKQHLASLFKDNMSFENYGKWHIDHIKPCALFDLNKPEEQAKCFHYTNLQPLWATDNLRKHTKY